MTCQKTIVEFTKGAMLTYGSEVNEDRAVPSFQDGLKPVGRRVLWAFSELPKNQQIKSARVIGLVLGKYHPHGESGPAGMLNTMVNSPVPPVIGIGNWGSLIDGPAAPRYTETKISPYGETFLLKNYLAVTPMVPNYDYKDKEPIYLPALLPNVLLNDSMGIGVGLATSIPSFTPLSLLRLMIRLLDKEKLTASDYARSLVFHECYGGVPSRSKENKAAILEFFNSPSGSIEFESPFQVNREAKKVLLKRFAPGLNLDSLLVKLRAMPEVDKVYSGKGLSYIIQVKRSTNFNDFDAFLLKLKRVTATRQKFSIYVTERQPNPTNPDKYDVQFHNLSVPQLVMKWLKFRVKLEKDSITYQIGVQEKEIEYTKLLIFACEPANLDIIFKALRQADPAAYIAKYLKVTVDQANQILDLKVRQLSKLDQDVLKAKLKKQQEWLKDLQRKLKSPSQEVKVFFEHCLELFEVNETRKQGMDQFWLKKTVG